MDKRIRVMIVDNSALVRRVLTQIFNSDPEIEVVAQAKDPIFAMRKIKKAFPNVMVLDIELPRMDGITFLKKLMVDHPIPVVICSSVGEIKKRLVLEAMQLGAISIITKPQLEVKSFLEESTVALIEAVKSAASAEIKCHQKQIKLAVSKDAEQESGEKTKSMINLRKGSSGTKIVAMGASTGGTEAILVVLQAMPIDCPGIVIVQHMPAAFTDAFAHRLNSCCDIEVRQADQGDLIEKGLALISPGDRHLEIRQNRGRYYVELVDAELVNRHKPSVDVLFNSVAVQAPKHSVGCIMTGMGNDGAAGLLKMKRAGAYTVGQDKNSCVVYGMPQEAEKLGAVERSVSLEKIAETLLLKAGYYG